jgi:tetratricopeptide (TPR) repeat protein
MNTLRKLILLALVVGFATQAARAGGVEDSFARGFTAYAQGDYKLALRQYRAALQWPGEHTARAYFNAGVCYFQLAQRNAAAEAFQAALKFAPRYFEAAYALGLTLSEQGREAEALQSFGDAVEWSEAEHPNALFEYGTRLALAGDFALAETRLRQALKYRGSHQPLAHNNLGVLLARAGDFQAAEQQFIAAGQSSAARFPLIANNLKLCRQLLRAQPAIIARWELTRGPVILSVQ